MSDGELPWPLFAILPDAGRFHHGVALVAFRCVFHGVFQSGMCEHAKRKYGDDCRQMVRGGE